MHLAHVGHDLPGAGAYGDALTRDLALVGKDLRDGLVSIEAAARDYGVVARGDPPEIDTDATTALRARLTATASPSGSCRPCSPSAA